MKRIKVPSFKSRRLRKWTLIFVFVTACIVFLGGVFASQYAAQQIKERLTAVGCSVGSVQVNIFTQRITISEFDLDHGTDSTGNIPIKAQIKNITLKSVSLYNLLVNKKLEINAIFIADGSVRFYEKKSSINRRPQKKEERIKKIIVDQILLQNINTTIGTDSLKQYSGMVNMTLNNIRSSDTAGIGNIKEYTLKDLEGNITDLLLKSSNGFYQTRIVKLSIAGSEEKLLLDSLIITPNYPKYKFSRVAGKQIDRINASIPRLEITGLQYDQLRDSVFIASKIEIKSPELHSFRDKRMRFKETKNKPLPVAAIKRLDFGIEVDTVQIKDAKISYEEFPSDGFKSGTVVFEDLQATLVNVSDKIYQNKPPYATLEARAKIMGHGLIQASFSLPLDTKKSYHAKGKISQMELHHLNPALENLAFIKIESGRLNNLIFDFDYNDKSSKGSLTINYQDLKITGLKKEKSKDESDIKTFLINTLVKNDKDKNVPAEKRTGAIEFERDRKRQIFNFWWKSLLSGIKSSVLNADKDSRKSKNSK
jgi:hypothetical protein